MTDCKYCVYQERGQVPEGMLELGRIARTAVLLLADQDHPGRCVLVSPWHARELFHLSPVQRGEFNEAVNGLAKLVSETCEADKVNVAFYGDLSDHLHAHVVPKWRGGAGWGAAFALQPSPGGGLSTSTRHAHLVRALRERLRGSTCH